MLVLAGGLLVTFLAMERRAGERGMVPLGVVRERSVACAAVVTFCNTGQLCLLAYYVS